MKIILSSPVLNRLREELRRAGRREIGGLLMGEHVQDETFRVTDISVQRLGGSHASFVRDPQQHQVDLDAFFQRTGANFRRFNYLGEWHSHPSFEPLPSSTDIQTMQALIDDPEVGANFLVLMIVRLRRRRLLESTALAFRRCTHPVPVPLEPDPDFTPTEGRAWRWLKSLLRSG